ncbi:carboxylating nicotinate-nucleotide diphosphorylase [Helicobacter pametensis]|uniref:carboxylating nicotinate-nucleotide diphosphorylase n=1 Tax=Helicobacter pametensis TaxID=95149 RepID=UPI0004803339|nr:carboxylating nicotinate-nucleotide diphosphorylase [Helicobacter pametensis]
MQDRRCYEFLKSALEEDWGRGDLFSLIAQDEQIQAQIIAKSDGIFSGAYYLQMLSWMMGLELEFCLQDSQAFHRGDILVRLSGSYLEILKSERVMLNLLQHSSGIATQTHHFMQKISDLPVSLLDTRKTRPLLREFEKYSVRNGGGKNHRFGLDDALMLKDTHLAKIPNLKAFILKARQTLPFTTRIEVECESLKQCKEAFGLGVDIIMCDNMQVEEILEVVKLRDAHYPSILLEASGNITLENIREYASSGVDAISCGALIHQATWLDMSMKIS